MLLPGGQQYGRRTAAMCHALAWCASFLSARADPTSYLQSIQGPSYKVADVWKTFQPSAKHEEIVAAAPDTWKVLPQDLDPAYRNPCWTDPTDSRFRCMPYFQILGVSKCGTTDLFARLKKHPEFADGSKGPHFWDECAYPPRGACTAPPNGDFNGYVDLFSKGAYQIKTNPIMVTGEASSNTFTGVFTFVRGLASRRKLNITLAQLIYEAQPYQRQIVVMRNPVSRYYSAFHYYRRRPSDPFEPPEIFHTKAMNEIKRWKECVAVSGEMACLRRYDPQQLIKGMYAGFTEAWTHVFPRDNILFLRNEDYQAAPREHLATVLKFLGMRDLTQDEWDRMTTVKRANTQSTRYPAMLPETKLMLEAFYAPYNERLAKMLKDDRYLWKDAKA